MINISALAAGKQYALGMKDVTCPCCAFSVEKLLNNIEGVENVAADMSGNVLCVTMAESKRLIKVEARTAV